MIGVDMEWAGPLQLVYSNLSSGENARRRGADDVMFAIRFVPNRNDVHALGRSLQLSDEIAVEEMRGKLAADGYRFDTLVQEIVTSPQFLNKRGQDHMAQAQAKR